MTLTTTAAPNHPHGAALPPLNTTVTASAPVGRSTAPVGNGTFPGG